VLVVNLHPEVEVEIVLNVARSPEEAELQASGKSIQELAAEEEAAAEFEIAELFDDIGAAQLDDGTVWITTGERGGTPGLRELAQDVSTTYGAVVRVTTDGAPAPDNPFLGDARRRPSA
jgi:hypothetical protein